MTWNFEAPSPYTYPAYHFIADEVTIQADDALVHPTQPLINSLDDLRAALADPPRLDAFKRQLAQHDPWFRHFFFDHNALDASVTARLLRRGWWQHTQRSMIASIHAAPTNDASAVGERGFFDDADHPIPEIGRRLVCAFAAQVRRHDAIPIVIVFNDRGYADHLWKALEPSLTGASIPHVNSAGVARPGDESVFLPDGHFILPIEEQLARQLVDVIRTATTAPSTP